MDCILGGHSATAAAAGEGSLNGSSGWVSQTQPSSSQCRQVICGALHQTSVENDYANGIAVLAIHQVGDDGFEIGCFGVLSPRRGRGGRDRRSLG